MARQSTVPVQLEVNVANRLDDSVEVAAYYVVAEALTNSAKYAQASRVIVHVDTAEENLTISIRDDGIGDADPARGSGLRGLMDRVAAHGGQMQIDSPTGEGTSLYIRMHCHPPQ